MAHFAGKFKAEPECLGRLSGPPLHNLDTRGRIKRSIALNRGQPAAVERQEVGLLAARRKQIADPILIAPDRAANIES